MEQQTQKDDGDIDLRSLFPEEFITSLLDEGLREDGRSGDQLRTTTVNVGSIATADGSSVVRCGGNCVTCGVKAELANPTEAKPDEGFIVVSLDIMTKLPGKGYGLSTSALTQTITDIIISSNFIDLKNLCIAKEQLCWVLYIDVVCTSVDGLPLDCSLLAIVAALQNVRLPTITLDLGKPVVHLDNTSPLALGEAPLSVTFGLNKRWSPLADPDYEEYSCCSGTLIVSLINKKEIAGLFKFGGMSLSEREMADCIKIAKKLCNVQRALIQTVQ